MSNRCRGRRGGWAVGVDGASVIGGRRFVLSDSGTLVVYPVWSWGTGEGGEDGSFRSTLISACDRPCRVRGVQSEHGGSGQVGGGGEEVEVGIDFGGAAHSCSSAAVTAAHQVSEFAFDFGAAVVTGFEVLANDGGQQLGRFAHFDIEDSAVEHTETGVRVGGEFGDKIAASGAVIPITDRFARRRVVVITNQDCPQLGFQVAVDNLQQPADRCTDHRHRVLGGDRVIQRCRVQHPFRGHDPRPTGGIERDFEDPTRTVRAGQPGTHIDQHRVHEPGMIKRQTATRILPTCVELERLDRLPIRQPVQACSTITVATICGGTDRRPVAVNRSANNSSGNNL